MSQALRKAMTLGLTVVALGVCSGGALATPASEAAAVNARIDSKIHAALAKLLKRTAARPTFVAVR